MIGSPSDQQEITEVSEVEHEPEALFGLVNGKTGMDLDAKTSLVDSLLREDSEGRSHLYGVEWGHGDIMNRDTPKRPTVGPDDLVRSYTAKEHGMEAERFQKAADVLARHYGSGTRKNNDIICSQKRGNYTYPDEEEEIKV